MTAAGGDRRRRVGRSRCSSQRRTGTARNVSAYDATYGALAESLGCGVLTADSRLSRAPGLRCPVTVLPG